MYVMNLFTHYNILKTVLMECGTLLKNFFFIFYNTKSNLIHILCKVLITTLKKILIRINSNTLKNYIQCFHTKSIIKILQKVSLKILKEWFCGKKVIIGISIQTE